MTNQLILYDKAVNKTEPLFLSLAVITIIASAFHFWPFEHDKNWQMINIQTVCCAIAVILAVILYIAKRKRSEILPFLPHVSVFIYLIINIISTAYADNLERPMNYNIKLILVFLGGMFLFQKALANGKNLIVIYNVIIMTTFISVAACLYMRLTGDGNRFGFHENVFKYGSYIGIFVPMSCTYLLLGSKGKNLVGMYLAIASVISIASAGAVLTIIAGYITALIIAKKHPKKNNILLCIVLISATLPISNKIFNGVLWRDFVLMENDGVNIKQRYLEWQAEINLLENRGIIGTGAGSINDYRSNYYYRLPKLNTLKSFDQNGWLAIAAETGIFGFIAFWRIIFHYSSINYDAIKHCHITKNHSMLAAVTANSAAFVSSLVANIFSSVQFNGILIVYVLVLCLVSASSQMDRGTNSEE
jgi:hypothetical protein